MTSKYLSILAIAFLLPVALPAQETITFPAADSLEITADVYLVSPEQETPFIVLCHQAGWSRGEYREIAPKLNEMGFNCMAIDQRSGKGINEVLNQTAARAEEKKLATDYPDALPDILAAIDYARTHYSSGRVLLWGSSYSSALVLKLAGDYPDAVAGVLSFSPGEYFTRFNKPADWISSSAAKIGVPVFITSAKGERENWQGIFDVIPENTDRHTFLPKTAGNHGSRALWAKFADSKAYWEAVGIFLGRFQTDGEGD